MKTIHLLLLAILTAASSLSQWNKIPSNTYTSLFASSFINSQTGWIAGQESAGKIFYTQNGGANWTLVFSTPGDERFESMYFLNSTSGWAGTYYSQVFRTQNGGQNWTGLSLPGAGRIRKIQFINQNTGWLISEGGLRISTNGGASWQSTALNSPGYSLYFFNQNTGIAATQVYPVANIYRTTNGGNTWISTFQNSTGNAVRDFDFINQNTGYAVGRSALVLKSTNGGINWSQVRVDTSTTIINEYRSVDFIDEMLGYACGQYIIGGPITVYGAIISKTTNGGLTWLQPTVNPNLSTVDYFEHVTITDGQTGYVVGSNGNIYKSTNAGYIGIQPISSVIPDRFSLSQNYPNPFNPVTKIKFQIPRVGAQYIEPVQFIVYDILGREIMTLINEELKPGTYEVEFDASELSSGMYFYKLTANNITETKKMVLIK